MWLGILLLVVSWLYPPWVSRPYGANWSPKWGFIFDPYMDDETIDYARLTAIDAVIIIFIAGTLVTLRQSKWDTTERRNV